MRRRRGVRGPRTAREKDAARLFDTVCQEWGIPFDGRGPWRLRIDTLPKLRLGQCRFSQREVGITERYVNTAPWASVEDTIRHEVAHILAGRGMGHGREWKAWARKVGARPAACGKSADECGQRADPKWVGTCEDCGNTWRRHRLTRRSRYGRCPGCYRRNHDTGRIVWTDHAVVGVSR